jgi:predicted enzyme related to lactoylglutathione lyase
VAAAGRCSRRDPAIGVRAEVALELHEAPDLGAVDAQVGIDVGGRLLDSGEVDAEQRGAKAPPNDRERRRDARSAGALRDPGRRHRPGTPVLGLPLRVAVRGLPGSVRVPHDPDQRSGGVAITNMEPGKRGIRPYFDVDDIKAGAARVKELGGEANDPGSVPGMGWFATCRDPQGSEFGLWQNDPSAPDTTG